MSEDPSGGLDASWADVIEELREVERRYTAAARDNRERQAAAPEPTGELEGTIRPPTAGHDPTPTLVIPDDTGTQRATLPRRPDGPPPLHSAALRILPADGSDGRASALLPDTSYQVACTIRNVGGRTASSVTFELFVTHREPTATIDSAGDGTVEIRSPSEFRGFCTLPPGSDRLFALGYNPPPDASAGPGYTPNPPEVIYRTSPSDDNTIRPDRTFRLFVDPFNLDLLVYSDRVVSLDDHRVRLYTDAPITASPPYVTEPPEIAVDPSATYLRTASDDDANDADPIDLSARGISAGDRLRLTRLGRYSKEGRGGQGMAGVFSSTDELGPSDQQNRVPGAIDAGTDVQTAPTFTTDEPTDIPEDFRIATRDGVSADEVVTVPEGAAYLFVSPIDNFFQDNTVPDQYAVRIVSQRAERAAVSAVVSTLETQATQLTDQPVRFTQSQPTNRAAPLQLAGDVSTTQLVAPPGDGTLPQKLTVPPTDTRTVTTSLRTPATNDYSLTQLHARVYSLAAPDEPDDWNRLDHTVSRFVGRTEATWQ